MSRHWTDGREGHDPGTWDECRKCAADRTPPLRAALERLRPIATKAGDRLLARNANRDRATVEWLTNDIRAIEQEELDLIRAALADTQDGAVDLDAAWREAEAALPEGFRLAGVSHNGHTIRDSWLAYALNARGDNRRGYGPTPAAALQALAARLRATPPPQPGEPA